MFPQCFQNWNCKTENLRAKTVACKMFRNKMHAVTKNGKNAKMAKMAKPGRGGGVPVPYQRLINCKKGHFWNFGHFSRAWVPRRAAQELYLSIKIHRNREVGPRTTFDQKSDNFRNRVFCVFFKILHFLSFSFCRFFDQNLKLESKSDVNCKKFQQIHFLQAIKVVAWT